LLRKLTVTGESPGGYSRDEFRLWVDEDDDGCDTREEVLIAQAVAAPTIRGICDIVAGSWISEYDRLELDDPSEIHVDHVVPLAEAWASGASAWPPARRERYANGLGVPWALIAVSSATNQAKGAADPTDWLPPRRADLCPYVAAWIGVKFRWSLSVDPAERASLARQVDECPNTRIEAPVAPD
jgi:hypothetical protein